MTGHTPWAEIKRKRERPAIRVDNSIIFPDGACRKMSLWERLLWRRGKRTIARKNARW